jgi:hypothetical protein
MLLYWCLPKKTRRIARLLMLGVLLVLACTGLLTLYIIKNIKIGLSNAVIVRTKSGAQTACKLRLENDSALPFDISMIDFESDEGIHEARNVPFPVHLGPEDVLEAILCVDYSTPSRLRKMYITMVFFLVPVRFPVDFKGRG